MSNGVCFPVFQQEASIIFIMLNTPFQWLARLCVLNKAWNRHSKTRVFMEEYVKRWNNHVEWKSRVEWWIRKDRHESICKWLYLLCVSDLYFLDEFQDSDDWFHQVYLFANYLVKMIGFYCTNSQLIIYICENMIDSTGELKSYMFECAFDRRNVACLQTMIDQEYYSESSILETAFENSLEYVRWAIQMWPNASCDFFCCSF